MVNKSNFKCRLGISTILLVVAGLTQAATITIGPGVGYDLSTIQGGIDAANDGDTVLVASGEYVITEPITFRGKPITVRSEAGADETIIRMSDTPTDPCEATVVIFEHGETETSVLNGFTLTAGRGCWRTDLNPPEAPCVWRKQWGPVGGGIVCWAASPTLVTCTIIQNRANSAGGMLCLNSDVILTDCIIEENSTGADGMGGGVDADYGSFLTLTNCIIKGNSAGNSGGGIFCNANSSMTMIDCIINGNTAHYGGGMKCLRGWSATTTLTRCLIMGNTSRTWGGGLEVVYGSAIVTNCTIARNMAEETGGGMWCGDGSVTITNSIFWANTAPTGREISLEVGSVLDITCSGVAGGKAGVYVDGSSTLNWGAGNIDADPLFVRLGYWDDKGTSESSDDVWVEGDYHLKSEAGRWDPNSQAWIQDDVTSPCIDRGDPNFPVGEESDPNGSIINMGAYGGTPEASMSIGQLPPILLALWRLDETESNTAHNSVSGDDAFVIGDPLWQPTGGKLDGALQLDGVNDCIITSFVLNPADGAFSVFIWINGNAPGQVILSQAGGSNWLCTGLGEGNLITELQGSDLSGGPLQSQKIITDDEWHRIGLVWDGTNRTLYVDGAVVAEDTQDGLGSSNNSLYIGTGKAMAPGTFWSGLVDDVRVYDVALSEEDIAALAQ